MRLVCAKVTNFRALEGVKVRIDDQATLIVGRNNSGKTSFVELFERFFGGERPRFTLDDLPTSRIRDLKLAARKYRQAERLRESDPARAIVLTDQAVGLLPEIRLRLTISYQEDEDLSSISAVIVDLSEECHEAELEARVEVRSALDFLSSISKTKADDKQLAKYFQRHFHVAFHAIGTGAASEVSVPIERSTARQIVSAMFVFAQVKFDDVSADRTRKLSRTFEKFIETYHEDEHAIVAKFENTLAAMAKRLDSSYDDIFTPVLTLMNTFGNGIFGPGQQPRLVSELDPVSIVKNTTRITYADGDGSRQLPEGHNGLGYSKLAFIVLQVISFLESHRRASPKPAVSLLFLEEPEAHLHPQMQEVFVRGVRDLLEEQAAEGVQVIVTTHSSHIVASGHFEAVRYFDCTGPQLVVKDLAEFRHTTEPVPAEETLRFLAKYMVLHRCDMFFADSVVLIEGTTERLLMPAMIRNCADQLRREYVSVVEVGDAYAYRFRELLAFLGVRTLVITDVDSVEPIQKTDKNGKLATNYEACRTDTKGAVTSNAAIKGWLPHLTEIDALLAATEEQRTFDRVRLAYQVAEEPGQACGRSFEEAFILANADILAKYLDQLTVRHSFEKHLQAPVTSEEIAQNAYDIAASLNGKKTDFAFDILMLDGWTVPRYIAEGLQWLIATSPNK
ncbi:ATP-dependent nuclease [Sphaerimonospora sp. CA-214678]|uniref:ATP-dependent nuclease n=1 Tax=Sphaerimonospora sp. CA-214678 TaxID=3240029 RepID=UPI003D9504A6